MRGRWGAVPHAMVEPRSWAEAIARRRADAHPRVVKARQDAAHAHRQLRALIARHVDARAALWRSMGDGQRPDTASARVAKWRHSAHEARRLLAEIEALPIPEAAALIQRKARPAHPERVPEAAPQARAAKRNHRLSTSAAPRLLPRRDLQPRL